MKEVLTLFVMFVFVMSVYASEIQIKAKNYPTGTFKKARNGKIIQYDNNGKRIGVYEINSYKYKRAQ